MFENALLVWDLVERDILTRIPRNAFPIQAARFRPDGGAVAAACSDSGEGVFVWERAAGRSFRVKPHVLRYPGDRCWAVAWAPDGATLAAAFDSGRIAWWTPGDAAAVERRGHRGAGCAAAFSPDGRLLLTAGKEGLIHVWDNATYSRRTTFDWRIGDIHGVAFAADGLTAAAAGNETVLLWDVDG
jgi:WD40 repeat protein